MQVKKDSIFFALLAAGDNRRRTDQCALGTTAIEVIAARTPAAGHGTALQIAARSDHFFPAIAPDMPQFFGLRIHQIRLASPHLARPELAAPRPTLPYQKTSPRLAGPSLTRPSPALPSLAKPNLTGPRKTYSKSSPRLAQPMPDRIPPSHAMPRRASENLTRLGLTVSPEPALDCGLQPQEMAGCRTGD